MEEDGYFLFTWYSGDFGVVVLDANGATISSFRLNQALYTRTQHMTAGEYTVWLGPTAGANWGGAVGHSLTITEMPPPSVVVLGEALVIGPQESIFFPWTVEEDSYFLFTWNSGNFWVTLFCDESNAITQFFMTESNHTRRISLEAGEYLVWLYSFDSEHNSVTITETEPPPPPPTLWQRVFAVIGPLTFGITIAVVIAFSLFVPLAWLGVRFHPIEMIGSF